MPLYVNIGGAKKELSDIYCNIGGAKKSLSNMYANIGGYSEGQAITSFPEKRRHGQ